MTSVSSGYCIGSCNWILSTGNIHRLFILGVKYLYFLFKRKTSIAAFFLILLSVFVRLCKFFSWRLIARGSENGREGREVSVRTPRHRNPKLYIIYKSYHWEVLWLFFTPGNGRYERFRDYMSLLINSKNNKNRKLFNFVFA